MKCRSTDYTQQRNPQPTKQQAKKNLSPAEEGKEETCKKSSDARNASAA